MKYSENVKNNNPVAYTIINNSIKNNKVPHAYLFTAQAGKDITDEYLYVIQELISTSELRDPLKYSDLTILDGSSSLIKKDDVTEAISRLQQTPLDEAGKKFLVIRNIENSNKQSINSLLKFIEEPTKDTYILMTTNNLSNVLPTIKSRSQIVSLKPVNIDKFSKELIEEGIPSKHARLLASVSTSKEKALEIYGNSFVKLRKEILKVMEHSLTNKNILITDLAQLITKDNFELSLNILSEFFSDIWREEQMQDLSFPTQKELIDKYVLSKYDFAKALESINNFIVLRAYHVNFDIQKNQLLILLGESYE